MLNRIAELRRLKSMSQQDLAARLSVGQTTISAWERGTREPDYQSLSALADIFGVSTDYILGREESALEAILGKPSPGAVRIPVLGRVAAGTPLYTAEEIIDWEEIPEAMAHGHEFFALKIKGQSMEPQICNGDVVIVRRQQSCDNGSVAIVLVDGDEATCKRIKFTDQGISLVSANPAYEPMFYTNKEIADLPIEILGVVVELRRTLIT